MVVTTKEENNNLEYQEKMNVDIEKVASKKQLFGRPIYEVIQNSYIEETRIFPTIILDQFKNNPNESQNIPNEIKAYWNMAMEQELYAHVVMIRQRESYDKKEKENTKKYNSLGISAI